MVGHHTQNPAPSWCFHILFGINITAIARRGDCDDVLFLVKDKTFSKRKPEIASNCLMWVPVNQTAIRKLVTLF
jgi:hypothetical protein